MSAPERAQEDVSVVSVLNVLLRHRGLLMACAFVGFALLVGAALLGARSYAAEATFIPQSRGSAANVAGIAAQFGISVPAGDPGQSPQFYLDLLESRPILRAVVQTPMSYRTDSGRVTRTLVDVYGIRDGSPAERLDAAIRDLRSQVRATVTGTGVVTLEVRAPAPEVAERAAARMLELVNEFNLKTRQSQAAAERRFAENRLTEIGINLRNAENRLQLFLQRNRQYLNAPALNFERERLVRDVAMHQQLYTSIAESHERAKLDEVRDIPVITVIEAPERPLRPEPRGLVRRGLIGILLGLALGVVIAFLREFFAGTRDAATDEELEFGALKRAAVDDLIHPWRPVARLFGRQTMASSRP